MPRNISNFLCILQSIKTHAIFSSPAFRRTVPAVLGNQSRRVRYSILRRSQISRTPQPKFRRTASVGRERREVERFDSLVGELSAAMARASADAVDREIEFWLG